MFFENFLKNPYVKIYNVAGKILFVQYQILFFGICVSSLCHGHWSSGAIFLAVNLQVFSWIWLCFFKRLAHLEQKNKDRVF